jgi:hypothetical protein
MALTQKPFKTSFAFYENEANEDAPEKNFPGRAANAYAQDGAAYNTVVLAAKPLKKDE